jgi:hypothetical protein
MYSDPAVFMLKLESGAEKDFMPQIKALFKKHRGSDSEIKSDSLFVEGDLGKYHVKVVFDNISENIYDEQANYSLYGALFLIKEKK